MNYKEVMKTLESMGSAQTRKIYARHGVKGKMFGVSYADLGKLKKKIKTDHALAEKLWAGKNHDARVLATMVADPKEMKSSVLDAWARDLDSYVLTDAFTGLAGRTAFAGKKMEKWMKSKNEWLASAGWGLLAGWAMMETDEPDKTFESYLERIEKEIDRSENRVRHAMNNALIAIGIRNPKLEKKAVAAAKRIGKIEVDHGETSCKTPDAAAYIARAVAHKKKRARRTC
jgi:3-methyladenine DNA glycosylase AlkD